MQADFVHPERVALFPRPAWASLLAGEHVDFCIWSVLRQHDNDRHGGRGHLAIEDAKDVIAAWRPGLNPASIRTQIRRGEQRGFWTRGTPHGTSTIWLNSLPRLLIKYGIETAGVPHIVSIASMVKPAAMKARIYATTRPLISHNGQFKSGIKSRATIEKLTGISPRAQQRYDNQYEATTLIQEVHAVVENHEGPIRTTHGFYAGPNGQQMRRMPDLRSATDHERGSRRAARNANHQARFLLERPEFSGASEGLSSELQAGGNGLPMQPESRGRVFYFARNEEDARMAMQGQCPYCAHHKVHDCPHMGGVIGWGDARTGSMQFKMIERRK